MSILSFLNTVYDTTQHSLRYGSPNPLILGDKKYDYNSLRYPLDIGSTDKGHYIVIHINTQTKTQFETSSFSSDSPTIVDNMRRLVALRGQVNAGGAFRTGSQFVSGITQQVASNQYVQGLSNLAGTTASATSNFLSNVPGGNKILGATTAADAAASAAGKTISAASKNINGDQFLRTISRTVDSITLYMPDTLNFEYRQNYDELRLGPGLGGLTSAAASIYDAFSTSAVKGGQTAAPFIASYALGNFGEYGRALSAGALGVVQNPMLELLYSQPNFRTFQFDFMLYPRDEKEALEVQKILERLRFHQAPEIKDSTYGYFLIPPSEFDIKFYYNGRINENIDQISTCILENILVNYAPSGFSAYESLGQNYPKLGSTGMPVAIQLTLMFKETQILTKESFVSKSERDRLDSIISSRGVAGQISSDEFFSEIPSASSNPWE
jgi:hypothetical protein